MTNWTKGPWRVLEGKYGLQIFSAKHWIANIKCESCPAHEEGNAHLIAAAPELYEVLVWVEQMGLMEHGGGGDMIRRVLAKARGEQ